MPWLLLPIGVKGSLCLLLLSRAVPQRAWKRNIYTLAVALTLRVDRLRFFNFACHTPLDIWFPAAALLSTWHHQLNEKLRW